MEITLRPPKISDPRFDTVVQFLQMALQQHPDSGAFAAEAVSNCAALRAKYADDPAHWYLSGTISMILGNTESARYFLATTIIKGLAEDDILANLSEMLANDTVWTSVDAYIKTCGSRDKLIDHYRQTARTAFDRGDLYAADTCCQRISALNKPAMTQFNTLDTLLLDSQARQDRGHLTAQFEDTIQSLQNYWSTFDVRDIESQFEQYAVTPDRAQFAALVADKIQDSGNDAPVIVEVGCFGGFNLNQTRSQLSGDLKKRARFIGIEPNTNVVAKACTLFPDIVFHTGDSEAMIKGEVDIPESMDVCMISRVLMVIMPEGVEKLLAYLAPRTDTLVICDDIFNVDGDMTVVRTPPNVYLVHNFRRMLEDAGFSIEEVIMADVPDRECTGFIVARGNFGGPA